MQEKKIADIVRITSGMTIRDHPGIWKAAQLLQEGKLVAFPTETVYGLGANAYDGSAVAKIFEVKGRPNDNPLIIHVSDMRMAERLVAKRKFNDKAHLLAKKFWPGPLTLVLPKSIIVKDIVTCGLDTVAVRMPNHPIALELIRILECPIAAPSANLSGTPSPTKALHVIHDMSDKIDMIIDGGHTNIGVESTVIDLCHNDPVILREGGVSKEEIEKELGCEVDVCKTDCDKPNSPGMKYRHYAPNAPVYIIERLDGRLRSINTLAVTAERMKGEGKNIFIIFSHDVPPTMAKRMEKLGRTFVFDDAYSLAHEIFDVFRQADEEKADAIIVEGIEPHGLGRAIMDRLRKAADGNIIPSM
jgi:L-threonylcarbamoyladenylate synthase